MHNLWGKKWNGSDMCILGEFVKVSVFWIFENEFCDFENNKTKWCKVCDFCDRNVIEMRGFEIGMFGVMKLSFLENEVTK